MPIVYLAGPITGTVVNLDNDWRALAKVRLSHYGIEGRDPMRHKDHFIPAGTMIRDVYPQHPLGSIQGIMGRDFKDVQDCDCLLANFLGAGRVSIGTVMEIAVAWWLHKPIVVVTEPADERCNPHEHAMLFQGTNAIRTYDLGSALDTVVCLVVP